MPPLQTVLLECEYFPCVRWYQQFIHAEKVIIEQHEYVSRASLRNRCYIAGPNGLLFLSVPLDGGRNQQTIMKDMKIFNKTNWQQQHWRSIVSCYGRSPYFEYYANDIESFFQQQATFLLDLNLKSLELLNKLFGIQKKYELSTEYLQHFKNASDDRQSFKLDAQQAIGDIKYLQPFEERNGFKAGLSSLDLLFCTGRQGLNLLGLE